MAGKRKRLFTKKAESSNTKTIIDTELYDVEKIVGSTIEGDIIYYNVKWENYPETDNSNEPEYRLICDNSLVRYMATVVDPHSYIDNIPCTTDDVEEMCKDRKQILEIIDPISTIAQITIFCGSVKFININTLSSKKKLLKGILSHNQSYILNSFFVPFEDGIQIDLDRYQKELDQLLDEFPDHAKLEIRMCPVNLVFYAPPPLSNILFEPVTEEMFENRETNKVFIPKSEDLAFNIIRPYIDSGYCDLHENSREINRLERADYNADPRFKTTFVLNQLPGRGWVLRLNEEVPENTPLMMMVGVIRPCETAQESLEEEGVAIALSSFIEIPDSGMCLDRREFHDFSKYIPHSCNPTCGVRLVNSGNIYPDVVIYSLKAIDASLSFDVTINYFKMFQSDVKHFFRSKRVKNNKLFHLYEKKYDFVLCQCSQASCSQVLYITAKKDRNPQWKKTRVETNYGLNQFSGLRLAESNELYSVTNGQFMK